MKTEKNCISCENFAWWDGDYCCVWKFKILCESKNGEFTKDILKNIKTSETCKAYRRGSKKIANMHKDAYEKFLKQITPHE